MIVTPYGHFLCTKMLQIACRFVSAILRNRGGGGGGGATENCCARSRNDVRRLTGRSNGMPSKKIMESLRTFVFVETVLRRCRMFQGSDEV